MANNSGNFPTTYQQDFNRSQSPGQKSGSELTPSAGPGPFPVQQV